MGFIYGTRIHKAFDKLAENIINTFKFTYFDYGFEDIKHEVVFELLYGGDIYYKGKLMATDKELIAEINALKKKLDFHV